MEILVFFLFLCFINSTLCKDCILDNRVPEYSWEYKLKEDLNCKYVPVLAVSKNSTNPLKVGVRFVFEKFSFVANENIFEMHSEVFITWYEDLLNWNPADYGGIDKIIVGSWEIWTPGLKLFNRADEDYYDFLIGNCQIDADGFIKCVSRLAHRASCSTKLAEWPYDTQNCTLHFGESNLNLKRKTIYTYNVTKGEQMLYDEYIRYGWGWAIVSYDRKENPNSTMQLSITFEVEREALGLAVIVMVPSLIVCILTLTSMILDIADNTRIGIVFLSILLHFSLIQEISESIPRHGEDTPLVLLHARSSLILTIIACFLTMFLKFLRKRVVPPPGKITALSEYVYNGYMKHIIWPRWGNDDVNCLQHSEDLSVNKKAIEEWTDFANIVNSVCITVFTIVYICLFMAYMPRALQSTFSGDY